MKEINGTLTLAFVEEDNRQRVIFRVIPLCTREGGVFHGGAGDFPDEGSLRIVPDKREQSTFKERMREIGGLCVIQLLSDGKELMKVRQNRNYAPDQGEKNQLAIYSDVICEFVEDGCFEVVEAGQDAQGALTKKVLIHKDKMLFGPVERAQAGEADLEQLKPFGNERYLLHTIEAAQVGGKHQICWDPEATVNWRQRRNTLRRRERATQEEVDAPAENAQAHAAEEKAEPVRTEKPKKPEPRSRRAERAAEDEQRKAAKAKPAPKAEAKREEPQAAQEEQDAALPIGAHLEILDSAVPFEQQISRLAQPLSEGANRLTSDTPTPADDDLPENVTAHFSGTPLAKNNGKPIRGKTQAENMHQVVEQQIAGQRDEVMGSELGSGTYAMVENPIETLRGCLEYVWQNADMRDQALAMLLANEAFTADMTTALRKGGVSLRASAAAQEQLADIEADRIGLLMQLETAKENVKKYREETIARASQKKRDEVERLKNEVKQLEATCRKLTETNRALSQESAARTVEVLSTEMTALGEVSERGVVLSPVLGHEYEHRELAEQLRVHMNASGYSISEDDAMSLLIGFSLCDAMCFCARTAQDARVFARVMLESFGLQSVSVDLHPGAEARVVSLLPENDRRTPTVTVQPIGTEALGVFGHKTIYVAEQGTLPPAAEMAAMPIVQVPPMVKRAFGQTARWTPVEPASRSSFAGLRADSHPLLSEAERWFADLRHALDRENVTMPENGLVCMRRFIEVASRKVRGGFLTAADIAAGLWVVPMLLRSQADLSHMAEALAGLPRTMEQLGQH